MDLYQDEEEPCDAGVPIPNLEPASVLEPIPMPVAKPCVPTTSPGIPESSHATQEDSDEDEDIWAKARRGRGSAEKAGGRKPTVPKKELAKAVGKVAAAAVTAALEAAGMHCTETVTGAKGGAAAVPADAAAKAKDIPHASPGVGLEHTPEHKKAPEHTAASSVAKQRASRGSAGTFAGRRPPKNAEKLRAFEAAQAAHIANKKEFKEKQEKARKEGQKRPSERTPDQRSYWKHLKEAMRGTRDPERAVGTYRGAAKTKTTAPKRQAKARKRPAACVRTQKPLRVKYVVVENGTVDHEPLQSIAEVA